MNKLFTLTDIDGVAEEAWESGKDHKVWTFDAQMGAGKTTFIHALCKFLQVTDVVSSPTFAIINEYYSNAAGKIYHMDWYRLKDEEEAIQAGVEDCLYSGAYCFVEWPVKAAAILPTDCCHVQLELFDENTRRIIVTTGNI